MKKVVQPSSWSEWCCLNFGSGRGSRHPAGSTFNTSEQKSTLLKCICLVQAGRRMPPQQVANRDCTDIDSPGKGRQMQELCCAITGGEVVAVIAQSPQRTHMFLCVVDS